MSDILVWIAITAAVAQIGLTAYAATTRTFRPWPPDRLSGLFGLHWLLVMGMAMPFFASLVTTAGSLYPVGAISLVGGLLFVLGAGLNIWIANRMDDPAEILGLEVQLHTDGLFRISRNPTVLGHLGAVGGLAIAAGSWQALLIATGIISWFLVRPYAIEPTLATRFERRYQRYRANVGRYLDLQRLQQLLDR